MKILVYDTETTWLPNSKEKDLSKQPYICQFAGVVWDLEDGVWTKTNEYNFLIKPPIPMPHEASAVHHIYDIDLIDAKPMEEYIEEICSIINSVDLVVWHNVAFDNWIVQIEVKRMKALWKPVDFSPVNSFCTMNETKNFCKLKSKSWNWYKRPTLWELYKIVFNKSFKWGHDALVDVKATGACFIELQKRGVIHPEMRINRISLF